jgi:uncharacterized protein YidB (DUF937 family)
MAGFDITSLLNQLMSKQQQQQSPQPQEGQAGEQGRMPAPANAMGAAPGGAAGGLGSLLSSGMVQKLAPMIGGLLAGGGLSKLMEGLKGAGAGSQAKSWVSADQPNQPVSGEQITQALGPEQISQVANTLGMTNEQAAHTMATALPQVVDAMTPDGHLPEGAGSAAGAQAAPQAQNRPHPGGASGGTPQGG